MGCIKSPQINFSGNNIQVLQWYKQNKYQRFIILPFFDGKIDTIIYKDGKPCIKDTKIHIPEKLWFPSVTVIEGIFISPFYDIKNEFIAYSIRNKETNHLSYEDKLTLLYNLGFITVDRPYLPLPEKLRYSLRRVEQNIYDLQYNCSYRGQPIMHYKRQKLLRKNIIARHILFNNLKYPCYQETYTKARGSDLSLTLLQNIYKTYKTLNLRIAQIMVVGSQSQKNISETRFFLRLA